MENIHYIVVIPLVLLIIYFQIRVFIQANQKIDIFKAILPDNKHAYSLSKAYISISEDNEEDDKPEDDSDEIWQENIDREYASVDREIEVYQISLHADNPTMINIKDALNMYLQKNKGAVSDFVLMKDVVERYCGAEEEEITVMQPIPLYMGLMGTMVGIIVGISVIAAKGGVQQLTNVSSMMTCVAIAMAASLVGIIFTTYISWKAKGAKTQIEARKNIFYSWLQTELLPVLSGNTASALSLLQANLMNFNQTFKRNIKKFDDVLVNVRLVSHNQAEALEAISRIDINRVAQANVTTLRELQKSTGQIEQFNRYLTQVNGYIDAVNSLNNNLTSHLDRTAAIEKMGVFFEQEIEQVRSREEYLKDVVGSIDSSLEQSFNQMVESMNTYFEELRNRSKSELETIREAYERQQSAFVKKLQEQQNAVLAKTEELNRVLQGLQSQSGFDGALATLTNVSKSNSKSLEQISLALSSLGASCDLPITEAIKHRKKRKIDFQNVFDNLIKVAALIAFILFAIQFASNFLTK